MLKTNAKYKKRSRKVDIPLRNAKSCCSKPLKYGEWCCDIDYERDHLGFKKLEGLPWNMQTPEGLTNPSGARKKHLPSDRPKGVLKIKGKFNPVKYHSSRIFHNAPLPGVRVGTKTEKQRTKTVLIHTKTLLVDTKQIH